MKIKQKTLDNGLTQVVVPMKDTPTATVLVMVNAGTRFETKENNGVSHFLEHMCFKGTEARPQPRDIATELDSLGAESNAFTWYEFTGYYGKTRSENASAVLDVLADIYKNSLLQEEEIAKEAGVITEEIRMYEDLPMRRVHDTFRRQLFGDQPAGWRVIGPEDVVQSLDREAIRSYRQTHYVPEATTVVVVGGVDPDSITDDITACFGDISRQNKKAAAPATYDKESEVVVHEGKDSDQTHLIIGAPAVDRGSDDLPAVELLSTILGRGMSSRLFHRLRGQMGVCYYVKSGVEYYSDSGVFKIATGVDTTRVDEVVAAITEEIAEVRESAVEENELQKAKEFLSGNFMLNHESTDEIANDLAEQAVLSLPLETPEDYVEKFQKVTREDVQGMAEKILTPDRLRLATVGPDIDQEKNRKILLRE